MSVQAGSQFDAATFRRGFEEWDIGALADLYVEDVEIVQVDRDNPPSAPRVRHGRESVVGMFTHCAAAGVKATVEHAFAAGEHGAARVTCEFPGGRRVVGNVVLEIEDGRIARQYEVNVGD